MGRGKEGNNGKEQKEDVRLLSEEQGQEGGWEASRGSQSRV